MASSTSTPTGVIRQGDVLIIPLKKLSIKDSVKLPNLTLAKGEVTGHSHRISEGKAELYERNGTLFLRILSPTAKLQHDEHHSLNILKGDWMVRIQREYRPIAPLENTINNNSNSQDTLTSKATFFQKNTVVDSATFTEKYADNCTQKKQILFTDELMDLANQIDFKYWDKLVEEAERKKEYLGRIQANKNNNKFDEQYEDEREYEKLIKRKNRIKYTETKIESFDNNTIPSSPTKNFSSPPSRQVHNWVNNLINRTVNPQRRN